MTLLERRTMKIPEFAELPPDPIVLALVAMLKEAADRKRKSRERRVRTVPDTEAA